MIARLMFLICIFICTIHKQSDLRQSSFCFQIQMHHCHGRCPTCHYRNSNYTLHVWDEDGGLFGADDDLGSVTFRGGVPVEQLQVHCLVFPVH